MNKPKSQRITPATMTGEQIADVILYGTYTKTALWSFISRNGGADAAHAKYPQLAVALHILKQERKKAKVLVRSRRSSSLYPASTLTVSH